MGFFFFLVCSKGNSRVERNRIEYDRTSSFELSRLSALVHNPAAIESAQGDADEGTIEKRMRFWSVF